MDWFEQLTGFREGTYERTQAKLKVDAGRLQSLANGRSYGVGEFEFVPFQILRESARYFGGPPGRLKASVVRGDSLKSLRMSRSKLATALRRSTAPFDLTPCLKRIGVAGMPVTGLSRASVQVDLDRRQRRGLAFVAL
jgi:hypothetical protein